MKKQKGSIGIFVLIALLFMSAFLIISFASNVNKSKIVKEQFNIISGIYAYANGEEGAYEKAYSDLRKKNKKTMTASVENSSTLELTKTFDENLVNYRIYGNTEEKSQNLELNLLGFLPGTGAYPTTNSTYANATYQIIEIKEGQTLDFNYTGYNINNVRVRYIDPSTDKVIGDVKIEENDYYVSTFYYKSVNSQNGYITAKKDFKLGIMYIQEKPSDFNLKVTYIGETIGIGDFINDSNDENYEKYKISIKLTNENNESVITNIILDNPLYEGEYIDYKSQKVVKSDGTEEFLNLPALKTYEDYTKIEVLTSVVPSKIEVEYVCYTLE